MTLLSKPTLTAVLLLCASATGPTTSVRAQSFKQRPPAPYQRSAVQDPTPDLQTRIWKLPAPGPQRDAAADSGLETTGLQEHPAVDLAGFLRTFALPRLLDDEDIQLLGGTHLAALARPGVLNWLDGVVTGMGAEEQRALVAAEVRIFRLEAGSLDGLRDLLGAPSRDSGGIETVLATPAEIRSVLTRLQADDTATAIQAPRIVVHEYRTGTVEIASERTYLKDFELEGQGGQRIADPVVGVVRHGISLSMIGAEVRPGLLALDVRLHHVELHEVKEFDTNLPSDLGGRQVTIELPRWTGIKLGQQVELPPGGTAVIASRLGEGHLLALVTVDRIPPEGPTGTGGATVEDGSRRERDR